MIIFSNTLDKYGNSFVIYCSPLPKGNVLLKIEEWEHTCHDGCCYTYGTKVFINNKQVTSGYANEIGTILEEVLQYLDYDVQRDFNRNVE